MARKKHKPKVEREPSISKTPRIETKFPIAPDDGRIHFRFRHFDPDFKPDGDNGSNVDCFYDIGAKLRDYARMGQTELRRDSSRNHTIKVSQLIPAAWKRLRTLKQDDREDIFSLHLDGLKRLLGILTGNTFYVLWWDPTHKICPTKKRNT